MAVFFLTWSRMLLRFLGCFITREDFFFLRASPPISLVNLRRATWNSKCSFKSSTLERIVLPHITFYIVLQRSIRLWSSLIIVAKTKHDSSVWHWNVAVFIPTMHLFLCLKWGLDCPLTCGMTDVSSRGHAAADGVMILRHCCWVPPSRLWRGTITLQDTTTTFQQSGRSFAGCSQGFCRTWSWCSFGVLGVC